MYVWPPYPGPRTSRACLYNPLVHPVAGLRHPDVVTRCRCYAFAPGRNFDVLDSAADDDVLRVKGAHAHLMLSMRIAMLVL